MKKIFALLLALLLMFSLAACGKTAGNEPEKDGESVNTTDPVTEDGTGEDAVSLEGVDLSTFTFGVTEDGENVVVTVKNTTAVGDVACVMTYVYEDGELIKSTADYYVPDSKTADALAENLKEDAGIVSDSVKVDGTCVSCQIVDSELEELRQLSREELMQAMEYAIANAQGQAEAQPAE